MRSKRCLKPTQDVRYEKLMPLSESFEQLLGIRYAIIEALPLSSPSQTATVRNKRSKSCRASSTTQEVLKRESKFLGTHCLLRWEYVSLPGAVNKNSCSICGSQRPETVFKSQHSSPAQIARWNISKSEVEGHCFLTTVVLQKTDTKWCYSNISLRNRIPYPRGFSAGWGSPITTFKLDKSLDQKLPNR